MIWPFRRSSIENTDEGSISSPNLPFGIDVSRWQGRIQWDVIASHEVKVCLVGIRASINWSYTDKWFARNWFEAKRFQIPRTAYHVVYPNQPAVRQIDHFLQVVGNDHGELPLTLDVELDQGMHYSTIAACVLQCAILIEDRTGRKPLIYSRALWVDNHITGSGNSPPLWLDDYDWWLALYLKSGEEHPGPPDLPKGVSRQRCKIHQTSQKGKPFGVESKQLDYDRWQGNEQSLADYINQNST